MSITDAGLVIERPHPAGLGVQRIYRWGRFGLSLVNTGMLHRYPFAWEAAVLVFESGDKESNWSITYDTELSSDVEVFDSDEDTNAFIAKAASALPLLEGQGDVFWNDATRKREESLARLKELAGQYNSKGER